MPEIFGKLMKPDGSVATELEKQFSQALVDLESSTDINVQLESSTSSEFGTDEEHFLLLQVVEDYLSRRYAQADPDSVMCIRKLLSHWIQKLSTHPEQPAFLVNKMAHIFSLVFAADFPDRWPNFMDEIFLSRGLDNVPIVVFYLKTLLAIDSEVVDRDIQRTKTVFDRNTKIKDFMRDICIPQIVQSWWSILESCSDVTAQCLCLDAVAAFVDWIDVELVANDVFVPLVIARLGNKDTSEAAVRAVSALIQKGIPASKKLSLVTALMEVMRSNHLISVNPRRILPKPLRGSKKVPMKQKSSRSRTLTAVHEAWLDEMVFPAEVVGKAS